MYPLDVTNTKLECQELHVDIPWLRTLQHNLAHLVGVLHASALELYVTLWMEAIGCPRISSTINRIEVSYANFLMNSRDIWERVKVTWPLWMPLGYSLRQPVIDGLVHQVLAPPETSVSGNFHVQV